MNDGEVDDTQDEQITEAPAENVAESQSASRELKPQQQKKNWPEFSKIIFVGVSVITLALSIFSCIVVWTTKDTTPLIYLIPAMFAELASATGFYFNKAKAENKIKLMSVYGVKPDTDSFGEN